MCGIVGYVGPKNCVDLLVDGLRRLEYRGYDSAGLAIFDGKKIGIVRAVGKLGNLVKALAERPLAGSPGIGHTRWATHGRPTEVNAHPHVSGPIALVHNGIIENHLELRRKLEEEGVKFASDTDTEIVAHLIHREADAGHDLFTSVRRALGLVHGAYAVAVIDERQPDRMVVAKNASPLVIGFGEGEMFCASDIPAILPYTKRMLVLEEGEIGLLTKDGLELEKLSGEKVHREPRTITWNASQAEKGGFKHFMLKEIHEQPRAIEDTLRGRVDLQKADVTESEMGIDAKTAETLGRVYFIACGTSHHATLYGRFLIEAIAGVPSTTELASEFLGRDPVVGPSDLVVAVSQSGETLDTLAALRVAREKGARTLAIANVIDSAIPRASHGAFYTHAGPEIGVASTKCFTTQLAAMVLLAVFIGRRRGTLDPLRAGELLQALVEVPNHMRTVLALDDIIRDLARPLAQAKSALFLGRGVSYPIAVEGALKLKEISYIHAEGYAAGEMKHGPIALIDADMPVIAVMPDDRSYEKIASNVQEAKAREGHVLAIATRGNADIGGIAEDAIYVPKVDPWLTPFVTSVPLQLLSYFVADFKGTDVDQPRNLAKTVTVE
ncbi:MAG TPA: glutamine--fructose-6-phosphate transaminase (isomerizing) [Polyangiaceae bacterium]|nr:glutamine--fructose-6-phosphate transaminase (isomerizing) [Polyangiaceae bacterium]